MPSGLTGPIQPRPAGQHANWARARFPAPRWGHGRRGSTAVAPRSALPAERLELGDADLRGERARRRAVGRRASGRCPAHRRTAGCRCTGWPGPRSAGGSPGPGRMRNVRRFSCGATGRNAPPGNASVGAAEHRRGSRRPVAQSATVALQARTANERSAVNRFCRPGVGVADDGRAQQRADVDRASPTAAGRRPGRR